MVDSLPKDGQEAIPALKDLNFIKERRNVILIGNSGTGKTHMAIAVGIRACEENYRVSFRTAAGLVNELETRASYPFISSSSGRSIS